jgi:hypothetical protein
MDKNYYIAKLAWFKQNEKPEVVLVIADNPEFIKIIIGWTNLEVTPAISLSQLAGESEHEIWRWLWENARFSLTDLKSKIGVSYSESVLRSKLNPLIGNRILYPDGGINSFAQRYLREQVLKLFETKPKKTANKRS